MLEPLLLRVVGAQVVPNPLINPPDDNVGVPRLKWNMVFPSSQCHRSTDGTHVSWSNGRDQPATFPRVTFMRIVSESYPFMLNISAKDRQHAGVTCGELIDAIADDFSTLSSRSDYEALPAQKRDEVLEAYKHNRLTAYDVVGDKLGPAMRRMDFLCEDTMFGGVVVDDVLVKRLCGELLPSSFVLRCSRRRR